MSSLTSPVEAEIPRLTVGSSSGSPSPTAPAPASSAGKYEVPRTGASSSSDDDVSPTAATPRQDFGGNGSRIDQLCTSAEEAAGLIPDAIVTTSDGQQQQQDADQPSPNDEKQKSSTEEKPQGVSEPVKKRTARVVIPDDQPSRLSVSEMSPIDAAVMDADQHQHHGSRDPSGERNGGNTEGGATSPRVGYTLDYRQSIQHLESDQAGLLSHPDGHGESGPHNGAEGGEHEDVDDAEAEDEEEDQSCCGNFVFTTVKPFAFTEDFDIERIHAAQRRRHIFHLLKQRGVPENDAGVLVYGKAFIKDVHPEAQSARDREKMSRAQSGVFAGSVNKPHARSLIELEQPPHEGGGDDHQQVAMMQKSVGPAIAIEAQLMATHKELLEKATEDATIASEQQSGALHHTFFGMLYEDTQVATQFRVFSNRTVLPQTVALIYIIGTILMGPTETLTTRVLPIRYAWCGAMLLVLLADAALHFCIPEMSARTALARHLLAYATAICAIAATSWFVYYVNLHCDEMVDPISHIDGRHPLEDAGAAMDCVRQLDPLSVTGPTMALLALCMHPVPTLVFGVVHVLATFIPRAIVDTPPDREENWRSILAKVIIYTALVFCAVVQSYFRNRQWQGAFEETVNVRRKQDQAARDNDEIEGLICTLVPAAVLPRLMTLGATSGTNDSANVLDDGTAQETGMANGASSIMSRPDDVFGDDSEAGTPRANAATGRGSVLSMRSSTTSMLMKLPFGSSNANAGTASAPAPSAISGDIDSRSLSPTTHRRQSQFNASSGKRLSNAARRRTIRLLGEEENAENMNQHLALLVDLDVQQVRGGRNGHSAVNQKEVAIRKALLAQEREDRRRERIERYFANLKYDKVIDKAASATVLFADMKGFTRWSSSRTAREVATMLNIVVAEIDSLAYLHDGVEKIKTIGDAYWAVTGLPEEFPNHADVMLRFAFDMVRVVEELNTSHHEWSNVNWRIGIHSGPLSGAIFGTRQTSYEVFGRTLTVCQKVESLGIPGQVCVTDATLKALNEDSPLVEYLYTQGSTNEAIQALIAKKELSSSAAFQTTPTNTGDSLVSRPVSQSGTVSPTSHLGVGSAAAGLNNPNNTSGLISMTGAGSSSTSGFLSAGWTKNNRPSMCSTASSILLPDGGEFSYQATLQAELMDHTVEFYKYCEMDDGGTSSSTDPANANQTAAKKKQEKAQVPDTAAGLGGEGGSAGASHTSAPTSGGFLTAGALRAGTDANESEERDGGKFQAQRYHRRSTVSTLRSSHTGDSDDDAPQVRKVLRSKIPIFTFVPTSNAPHLQASMSSPSPEQLHIRSLSKSHTPVNPELPGHTPHSVAGASLSTGTAHVPMPQRARSDRAKSRFAPGQLGRPGDDGLASGNASGSRASYAAQESTGSDSRGTTPPRRRQSNTEALEAWRNGGGDLPRRSVEDALGSSVLDRPPLGLAGVGVGRKNLLTSRKLSDDHGRSRSQRMASRASHEDEHHMDLVTAQHSGGGSGLFNRGPRAKSPNVRNETSPDEPQLNSFLHSGSASKMPGKGSYRSRDLLKKKSTRQQMDKKVVEKRKAVKEFIRQRVDLMKAQMAAEQKKLAKAKAKERKKAKEMKKQKERHRKHDRERHMNSQKHGSHYQLGRLGQKGSSSSLPDDEQTASDSVKASGSNSGWRKLRQTTNVASTFRRGLKQRSDADGEDLTLSGTLARSDTLANTHSRSRTTPSASVTSLSAAGTESPSVMSGDPSISPRTTGHQHHHGHGHNGQSPPQLSLSADQLQKNDGRNSSGMNATESPTSPVDPTSAGDDPATLSRVSSGNSSISGVFAATARESKCLTSDGDAAALGQVPDAGNSTTTVNQLTAAIVELDQQAADNADDEAEAADDHELADDGQGLGVEKSEGFFGAEDDDDDEHEHPHSHTDHTDHTEHTDHANTSDSDESDADSEADMDEEQKEERRITKRKYRFLIQSFMDDEVEFRYGIFASQSALWTLKGASAVSLFLFVAVIASFGIQDSPCFSWAGIVLNAMAIILSIFSNLIAYVPAIRAAVLGRLFAAIGSIVSAQDGDQDMMSNNGGGQSPRKSTESVVATPAGQGPIGFPTSPRLGGGRQSVVSVSSRTQFAGTTPASVAAFSPNGVDEIGNDGENDQSKGCCGDVNPRFMMLVPLSLLCVSYTMSIIGTSLSKHDGCFAGIDITYLPVFGCGALAPLVGVLSWLEMLGMLIVFVSGPGTGFVWFSLTRYNSIVVTVVGGTGLAGLVMYVLEKFLRLQFSEKEMGKLMEQRVKGLREGREAVLATVVPRHVIPDLFKWFAHDMAPEHAVARSIDRIVVGFIQLHPPDVPFEADDTARKEEEKLQSTRVPSPTRGGNHPHDQTASTDSRLEAAKNSPALPIPQFGGFGASSTSAHGHGNTSSTSAPNAGNSRLSALSGAPASGAEASTGDDRTKVSDAPADGVVMNDADADVQIEEVDNLDDEDDGSWMLKLHAEVDDLLGHFHMITKIKTVNDVVMFAGPFEVAPGSIGRGNDGEDTETESLQSSVDSENSASSNPNSAMSRNHRLSGSVASSSASVASSSAMKSPMLAPPRAVQGAEGGPALSKEEMDDALALAVMESISLLSKLKYLSPGLRAGVHVGSVFGACQGSSRLSFDIFGDSVNVASRVMTGEKPGSAAVSSVIKDLLMSSSVPRAKEKADMQLGPGQTRSAKGKGEITVHKLKL